MTNDTAPDSATGLGEMGERVQPGQERARAVAVGAAAMAVHHQESIMIDETTNAPAPAAETGETDPFDAWYEANAVRFHAGQFSVREIAYSAWYNAPQAAEAERDRLALELAAVRGALPDPALLDYAAGQLSVASRNVHIASSTADQYRDTEDALTRAAARIRALAATPTPLAAEAGTGGWAREAPAEAGTYWGVHYDSDYVRLFGRDGYDPFHAVLVRAGTVEAKSIVLWGPRIADPPDGWREALAALDTPQEATDE